MNDDEGSSDARPSDTDGDSTAPKGFWRIFLPTREEPETPINGTQHGAADYPAERLGISNLRRMQIADVAVPKGEIVAVAVDTDLAELVETFRESGFTRLPVYEGTLDRPIGMVHLKDVALKHGFNCADVPFDMRALVRPLIYAPPSMPIDVLMQKMQSQRMHMALVIDEYGGTDGVVTIEDLIEQVVGEIEDEHDVDEDQPWTVVAPGTYVALARAPLDEFEAEIGMDLSVPDTDDEADTLGGVVFLLTGRVPARGEIVQHPSGVEIEVVDADPRRIKRLRIQVPTADADGV